MAILDLQGVPWRVAWERSTWSGSYTNVPASTYAGWAVELGVSSTETLVDLNGDNSATALSLDYPCFAGSVANTFVAMEGGIGFYQAVPSNTSVVAYSLSAYGISKMFGFNTRPNLLLSFHPQYDMKILASKVQKRYGVTILYLELAYYYYSSVFLYAAIRLEPGRIIISGWTSDSYATPWILTELNPATGAVIQSTSLLTQASYTHSLVTIDLSNNHGLLAGPRVSPALVGSVATSGILRAVSDQPFAVLGSVPTVGVLRCPALANPAALGTAFWPVLANHASAWGGISGVMANHAAHWSDNSTSSQSHQAAWRMRLETALSASWAIPMRPPVHALGWGDLAVVRASRVHPWDGSAAPRRAHTAAWSDTAAPRASLDAPWSNVATVAPEHVAFWADGVAPRRSVTLAWSDRSRASQDHVLGWGDGEWPAATHQAAWGDVSAPRRAHQAPWADTASALASHTLSWADTQELRVSLALPWSDRARASDALVGPWQDGVPLSPAPLVVPWSDRSGARRNLENVWSDGLPGRQAHGLAWSDPPVARAIHEAVYADREAAESTHAAAWSGQSGVSATLAGAWSLTAVGRQPHASIWGLASRPAARASLTGRWALLADLSLLSISNVPTVRWRDQTLAIHGARLSLDEDSPVWLAEEIELADLTAWGAIALGDELEFIVQEETWRLRVDGKGLTRPAPGALRLTLSAVSPLAWLDAPYAAAITLDNTEGPVSAQATVAGLLAAVGTLRWELDDWLIPAGALAMSDTTPVQAAREIVAAIGGVLESDPDGTPVARQRHPVTVPDYAVATPDHVILDADLFAFQVSAAPSAGFNRVVISNEDLSGSDVTDRMEYLDEDGNKYDGEMRAWPHPWRPVTLGHTGHPETEIEALGARSHAHTELVEFVAGRGRTDYPVQAITGLTWQHADLGSVSASGTDLTAASAGQSLAWVTYTSLSLDWRVALARDEAVQFVLL